MVGDLFDEIHTKPISRECLLQVDDLKFLIWRPSVMSGPCERFLAPSVHGASGYYLLLDLYTIITRRYTQA